MSQTIDITPAERTALLEQPGVPAVAERRSLATIFQPQSFEQALMLCDRLAGSNLVPTAFRGKAADILVAIMKGAEVGLQPMQALESVAVINGRPALFGDAPLALVEHSGLLEDFREWLSDDDGGTAHCFAKRRGRSSPIERAFSMADAEKAGLKSKEGPWRQYPKRMLQMRARAFALRDGFPDVLKGMHIREEWEGVEVVEDQRPEPIALPQRVVDVQPDPAGAPAAASPDPNGDPPAATAAAETTTTGTAAPPPPPPSGKEPKATQPQRDAIKNALARKKRSDAQLEEYLLKTFGITELLDLPAKHVNSILKWIDGLEAGAEAGK